MKNTENITAQLKREFFFFSFLIIEFSEMV